MSRTSPFELSALNQQRLNRRIPDMVALHPEIAAWEEDRNQRPSKIDWQFRSPTPASS